jgi:cyclopropane fatty-acyl-phospholipid synthase-like methyltransferase
VPHSGDTVVEYIAADVLEPEAPMPFDLIWCTGVLYHVKEQYRLIRRFYDWLTPGGVLVLESATIRRWWLRNQRCVEILYPPDPRVKKRYHLSFNITHLPSQSAVLAWLQMAGFVRVERSGCHRRVSRALAKTRVAYISERPTSF